MWEANENDAASSIEGLTRDGGTLFGALVGEHPATPADDPVVALARTYHANRRIPTRSFDRGEPVDAESASRLWRALVRLHAALRADSLRAKRAD